ncbi:MAG: type II toxin-antitoxin system RelE/ParE family toxin [Clostridia bacterium]|nr:type II toxin-antitoxin system RelE/ParE family toxin [Clostridia bacterium]
MRIMYTPASIEDIESIANYIKDKLKSPTAATTFKTRIVRAVSLLKDSPNMGVKLSEKTDAVKKDYRFIIVNNYLIFYRIEGDVIVIVRILDGRTDYLRFLT